MGVVVVVVWVGGWLVVGVLFFLRGGRGGLGWWVVVVVVLLVGVLALASSFWVLVGWLVGCYIKTNNTPQQARGHLLPPPHTPTHTSSPPQPTEGVGGRRLGLLVHARAVLERLEDEVLQARDGGAQVALRPQLADAEEGEVAVAVKSGGGGGSGE